MYKYIENSSDYSNMYCVGVVIFNRRNAVIIKNKPHRRVLDVALAKNKLKRWFQKCAV